MKSNNKIIVFLAKHVVLLCTLIFTLCMLLVGLIYAYGNQGNDADLAGTGAFLSGVFAPIAWVWFLASYTIQSKELKLQNEALTKQTEELSLNREELSLQREELRLQREAIEQSVIAQQGSEQALQEQSKALQSQLKISSQQYEYAIEQRINNKPKFILPKIHLNALAASNNLRPGFFRCNFSIVNIGSDAKIRMIEVFTPMGQVTSKTSDNQDIITLSSPIYMDRLTRACHQLSQTRQETR